MPELIEVRFKGNRKDVYIWDAPAALGVGDAVVVEAERGLDLGVVSAVGETAQKKCGVGCAGCAVAAPREPRGKVVRAALPDEARQQGELRKTEEDVRRKVIERVRAHGLAMKVSDAEWQWDRHKLTAPDLLRLKVIDEVVPEPPGGAHADPGEAAAALRAALDKVLRALEKVPPDKLVRQRADKYRRIGTYTER